MSINVTSIVSPSTAKIPSHSDTNATLSPLAQAMLELEETSGAALNETLEEISMVLSGKLREMKNGNTTDHLQRRRRVLVEMLSAVDLPPLAERFNAQQEGNELAEFNTSRTILALTAQLISSGLSPDQRKAKRKQLDDLLAQGGWEIELFGVLELDSLPPSSLEPLKRLFQQTLDEEAISLSEWFQRIVKWPQRRQRVMVLLRAIAFELNTCTSPSQQQRLATVVSSLRRLLIFLGLENECFHQEALCELRPDCLLPLVIEIIGQRWLFDDWMLQQLDTLVPSIRIRQRLLHHLDALFILLPDVCFDDDEQREQILTVLHELKASVD